MFSDQRFCPTMTVLKGEGRNTLGSSLRPEVRFLIILAIFPLCADLLTFPDFAWNSGLPAIGCSFAHVVHLQIYKGKSRGRGSVILYLLNSSFLPLLTQERKHLVR